VTTTQADERPAGFGYKSCTATGHGSHRLRERARTVVVTILENSRQADAGLIAIRLGLAISRSLVEAASGELALMDGEALGFVVRLPVNTGQA